MIHHTTNLPNIGILNAKFTDAELKPILNEINEIKNKNFSGTKINSMLAGNMEHEFELIESYSYVSFLLAPVLKTYNEQFGVIDSMSRILFNKPTPTRLAKLWVNFQQKHDFNPIHRHGGAVSFVIWIDIPYDINVEKHHSSSKNSAAPVPGYFQFTYVNILGEISSHNIPADSKFKNQMVMFPAGLPHCVYPFRTSDEYRISVSGNFVFDT
jgi:hypothetical protein